MKNSLHLLVNEPILNLIVLSFCNLPPKTQAAARIESRPFTLEFFEESRRIRQVRIEQKRIKEKKFFCDIYQMLVGMHLLIVTLAPIGRSF